MQQKNHISCNTASHAGTKTYTNTHTHRTQHRNNRKLSRYRSESDRHQLVLPICWVFLCFRKAQSRSEYKDPTREQSRIKILKPSGMDQFEVAAVAGGFLRLLQ